MNVIDSVKKTLSSLINGDILQSDAQEDIRRMLRIHESGELPLVSSGSATYPFLLSPNSPGGITLRDALNGYSGDFLDAINQDPGHQQMTSRATMESGDSQVWWHQKFERAAHNLANSIGKLTSQEILACIIAYNETLNADKSGVIGRILRFSGCDKSSILKRLLDRQDTGTTSLANRFSLVICSHETGYFSAEVVERWGQHVIVDDGSKLAAPNGLWIPERVVFLPEEIQIFEELLNRCPSVTEGAFQEFFEAHPKWLYLLGEQYEKLESQVMLPPVEIRESLGFVDGQIDAGEFYPDFMLKRIGLELWDVLDIKRANPSTVVGKTSRRKFSEAVQEAVAQLREYQDRLGQNEVRNYLRCELGITVARPIAMVIIGRDFEFQTLREKDLFRSAEGVRIYTYDDLRRLARHREILI